MIGLLVPVLAATSKFDGTVGKVLLAVAIVVVLSRGIGWVFARIGQPAVLGEILAGIALGPSLLGLIKHDLPNQLFPRDIQDFLRVIAQIGLLVFMFVVGLEVDLNSIRRSSTKAVAISLSSIVLPFALGFAVLAPYLHNDHNVVDGKAVKFLPQALFLGVAMSGTAFPVLARILSERNMFRIPLGMLAIACAAVDDLVVFILLTVTVAVAQAGDLSSVPGALALTAIYCAVLFLIVRPLIGRLLLPRFVSTGELGNSELSILIAGVFAAGFGAQKIGLAPLIGAFLYGFCIPRVRQHELLRSVTSRVETFSVQLLLPVFFIVTGLSVDIRRLGWDGVVPTLLIIAIACVGKFVGAGAAAKVLGMSTRQSVALGTLLNTRGLTEIVILQIGKSAGVIDTKLFTMMVIMAIVTTVAAGPLMRVVYPQVLLDREIADADRLRSPDRPRTVITAVLDGRAADEDLAQVAAGLARSDRPGLVHLVRLLPTATAGTGMLEVTGALGGLQKYRQELSGDGVEISVMARRSNDLAADLVTQLAQHSPDITLISAAADDAVINAMETWPGEVAVVGGQSKPSAPVHIVGRSGRSTNIAADTAARLAIGWNSALTADATTRLEEALNKLERVGVQVEHDSKERPGVTVLAAPEGASLRDVAASSLPFDTAAIVVRAPANDRIPLAERLVTESVAHAAAH